MADRPFIPANYPKSFVLFVLAGLGGLAAGGLTFLGFWIGSVLLENLGRLLFFGCWAAAAAMFVVFLPRAWSGRYRNLPAKPWREQVW